MPKKLTELQRAERELEASADAVFTKVTPARMRRLFTGISAWLDARRTARAEETTSQLSDAGLKDLGEIGVEAARNAKKKPTKLRRVV